jgi:hypothetical protein
VTFRGAVLNGGTIVGRFAIQAGDALGNGCFSGDTAVVGKLSDHLGRNGDVKAFLAGLTLQVDTAPTPLINDAIDNRERAARRAAPAPPRAAAAPTPAPATTPLVLGPTAMVRGYQMLPGKDADYERVLNMVRGALLRSTKPEARRMLAGWKIVKATTRDNDGTVYVHIYDPVVEGSDYILTTIFYDNVTDTAEMKRFFEPYRGALKKAMFEVRGAEALRLLTEIIDGSGAIPLERIAEGIPVAGPGRPAPPAMRADTTPPAPPARPATPANPATSGTCPNGRTVTIKDAPLCLVREVGYPIVGRYEYESPNGGEPMVVLNADGTGQFQRHGSFPTRIEWGVEADATGAPKKVDAPGGAVFRLYYQDLEQTRLKSGATIGTAGEWDVVELWVSPKERQIYILRERVKAY